jgi:hypothetical protein
MVVVVP